MAQLISIVEEVRHCELCRPYLTHGPRPVVQVATSAKIMIIGQAPGARVHATGIPWNDPSGERLRDWMGIKKETFYDQSKIAIMPMGFCYPGKGRSGDLPPRPECAPKWHAQILGELPNIKVTLLIGQYAQKYYLQKKYLTLTETVKNWPQFLPDYFPLPHPSPRNQLWLKKNPWFEETAIAELQNQVSRHL